MLDLYSNGARHQVLTKEDSKNFKQDGVQEVVSSDYIVTVGANGNFQTINEALKHLSNYYPVYKKGGITCGIKILSGTTINEQICVVGLDLSYITITSEDDEVSVNVDGFTSQGLNSHDLRSPNVGAFIGGENGAKLPTVGCVFKVTQNTDNISVVGYFANRGSCGVVLSNSGFDGFYDGVISNNESSVTIREGIARNMSRWGVHPRHNGEVSARSAILTGCVVSAYADRVADLDVREAYMDNSKVAIQCFHTSRVNANGCHITNAGAEGGSAIIQSSYGSIVNCIAAEIVNPKTKMCSVSYGSILTAHLLNIEDENSRELFNQTRNTLTSNGVIFA